MLNYLVLLTCAVVLLYLHLLCLMLIWTIEDRERLVMRGRGQWYGIGDKLRLDMQRQPLEAQKQCTE